MKYLHNVRTVLSRSLCALAGLALCGFGVPYAHAGMLWTSAPNNTGVFEGLEEAPGTIGMAEDPTGEFGLVYKYSTWDDPAFGKERVESRGTNGFRPALGSTIFIGWRERWDPMPILGGDWVAFWQMHGYGTAGQGAPLVLRTTNDGKLHMQNNVNGTNVDFWTIPFPAIGSWNSYVVEVHLETNTTGWVKLWYNGVAQTFINGKTTYNCPLWDSLSGSYVLFKWGVYRSGTMNGKGAATTWMTGAKIGTSYADVAP